MITNDTLLSEQLDIDLESFYKGISRLEGELTSVQMSLENSLKAVDTYIKKYKEIKESIVDLVDMKESLKGSINRLKGQARTRAYSDLNRESYTSGLAEGFLEEKLIQIPEDPSEVSSSKVDTKADCFSKIIVMRKSKPPYIFIAKRNPEDLESPSCIFIDKATANEFFDDCRKSGNQAGTPKWAVIKGGQEYEKWITKFN